MLAPWKTPLISLGVILTTITLAFPNTARAEEDSPYSNDIEGPPSEPPPPQNNYRQQGPPPQQQPYQQQQYQQQGQPGQYRQGQDRNRRYFVPDTNRTDAGIFHVAFAVGGNFWLEPSFQAGTRIPDGYFKDFGFQAGIVFDYDYSALTENVPLGLRMMIGYKYILNSVHVFGADGVVRYIFRVSDHSNFGLGAGVSAALWYRAITTTSTQEEALFLPSFIIEAGFDFNPFMVDFKWLINRMGEESTITGFELYFGIRL